MARIIFGAPLPDQEANLAKLVELGRAIAMAEPNDSLASLSPQIQQITRHVAEKEEWFATYFAGLRKQLNEAVGDASNQQRNKSIRAFTASSDAPHRDAIALVKRAYSQSGQVAPDPIPDDVIALVASAAGQASHAVGVLLERIMCDNADLAKPRIRNLLWDQEIAGHVGRPINGMPLIVITNDAFFREAASRAGNTAAVCSAEEYLARLTLAP